MVGSVPGHCLHVRVTLFLCCCCFVCLFVCVFFWGGGFPLFFYFYVFFWLFFFFVLLFFSFLQNAPIAMIFDDAINLFIYFFAFYFNVIASKSLTKIYSENGREK